MNLSFFSPQVLSLVNSHNIPGWFSPPIIFFIVALLGIYYSESLKKAESFDDMSRVTFVIYSVIKWISKTTYDIIGKSYKAVVPFFIYIIGYFWLGSIVAVFGLPSVGTNPAIPFSVSMVVFLGTIISGMVHQRWYFFKDFFIWIKWNGKKILPIPDPLKFIGELSKVISLSCRLWGNCLAGSVILFICYYSLESIFDSLNASWAAVLTIPSVLFPLHIYFDIIDGGVQAGIFMFLTMSYWAMASQINEPNIHPTKEIN